MTTTMTLIRLTRPTKSLTSFPLTSRQKSRLAAQSAVQSVFTSTNAIAGSRRGCACLARTHTYPSLSSCSTWSLQGDPFVLSSASGCTNTSTSSRNERRACGRRSSTMLVAARASSTRLSSTTECSRLRTLLTGIGTGTRFCRSTLAFWRRTYAGIQQSRRSSSWCGIIVDDCWHAELWGGIGSWCIV